MTSPARPLISVITPFYNTARYLPECVESVLRQDHENLEYILVDNQSTDGSGDIAAAYAQKDRRLRVIKTERFLSQVQNYNFALRQISRASRYCKMVQADDWLFPRCLTELVHAAETHPSAAIVSSYELKGTEVHGTGLPPETRFLPGREACRLHLLKGIYLFGSPTTLLFRADVVRVRDPFYAEGRLHEDTEAVYELLRRHDLGFVHQVLSFTRVHADSISGATRDYLPNPLDRLILVKRYGRDFLTSEELARCLADAEKRYYRGLARAGARRERAFWDYHRQGLASVGETLDPMKLVREASLAALNDLLAPKELVRRIARSLVGSRATAD